jgi:hypothetical protein
MRTIPLFAPLSREIPTPLSRCRPCCRLPGRRPSAVRDAARVDSFAVRQAVARVDSVAVRQAAARPPPASQCRPFLSPPAAVRQAAAQAPSAMLPVSTPSPSARPPPTSTHHKYSGRPSLLQEVVKGTHRGGALPLLSQP